MSIVCADRNHSFAVRPESGLDRLDSVSVRVDELVKDGPKGRRLRRSSILDKFINTNNWQPSDQGRHPIIREEFGPALNLPARGHSQHRGRRDRGQGPFGGMSVAC
jgi:hypothetical protein